MAFTGQLVTWLYYYINFGLHVSGFNLFLCLFYYDISLAYINKQQNSWRFEACFTRHTYDILSGDIVQHIDLDLGLNRAFDTVNPCTAYNTEQCVQDCWNDHTISYHVDSWDNSVISIISVIYILILFQRYKTLHVSHTIYIQCKTLYIAQLKKRFKFSYIFFIDRYRRPTMFYIA